MKTHPLSTALLAAIVFAAGCAIDSLDLKIHNARTAGMEDGAATPATPATPAAE